MSKSQKIVRIRKYFSYSQCFSLRKSIIEEKQVRALASTAVIRGLNKFRKSHCHVVIGHQMCHKRPFSNRFQ
jgi:hypothetical protein